MICISGLILLFNGIVLLPVTVGSSNTLILVAEPGDDVTIWYQCEQTRATYVYWFKHTDSSVPHRVACQLYTKSSKSMPCSFFKQSNQMGMSVNSQNTSLTITAVNYTDSGLYYCGIQWSNLISFSNATYLHVTEQNERLFKSTEEDVYFMLTVVFGGVIVILISVLLVMLKRRERYQDETDCKVQQEKEEQDSKYAALQFSDKKIKKSGRHTEVVDTKVVYSSVRH
ncbi:uncharacterized protein LOC118241380 [Electrophorus electricus]|uniref:uncharacterized protein LOC118241380 n=1 Tax=Electrophorus electricus TaxID=8005 RepID=UPI0015D0951C|nr:uncharacterized protein LOC118241380 [Electrophorus electricus]